MTGIYKITNPNDKVYIGQSINIEKRLKNYYNLHCNRQPKILRSLIKYGVKNHKFETIEKCNISELNTKERYWQEYYDVLNNGLNCYLTETGLLLKVISKQTKLKISKTMIGKINSLESKKKLSATMSGRICSEETKIKISKHHTGVKKGRYNINSKKIIQLDLENNFIKEWGNIIDINNELNIIRQSITNCCLNKQKTAGKFKWKYKEL